MKLANLIIAGVNKAGSTSLFHYLIDHPQICGSKNKEACYFLPLLYGKEIGPISDYASLFRDCGDESIRLESTPSYFFGGRPVAEAIQNVLEEPRILVILKDPVERLVSFYNRKFTTFQVPQNLSFEEYVDKCFSFTDEELKLPENHIYTGVIRGRYSDHMSEWFEVFNGDLKVIFFDDLSSDPESLMHAICKWMGLDSSKYENYDFDVKNRSMNYSSKFIHRIAVSGNTLLSAFWRRNQALKRKLITIYYQINGKPIERSHFNTDTLHRLYSYFRPYNNLLLDILRSRNVENLPEWLTDPEYKG
jgi:hypothetical protein